MKICQNLSRNIYLKDKLFMPKQSLLFPQMAKKFKILWMKLLRFSTFQICPTEK